jgi:hypothetical protein
MTYFTEQELYAVEVIDSYSQIEDLCSFCGSMEDNFTPNLDTALALKEQLTELYPECTYKVLIVTMRYL